MCMNRGVGVYKTGESGSTAIEFALLVIPYLLLCVAIIEMSIMFASASLLEGATGQASRMLRTGQIQQASADPVQQEQMFRDALCDFAVVMIDCDDIQLEVQNMGSFSNFANFTPRFTADGNLESNGFTAGGANDVMLIRTAYRYTLMTPFIGHLLGEGGTNSRLFVSTIVLQTEPYEFSGIPDNV